MFIFVLEYIKYLGLFWHNKGNTLSNIKDGPYPLTSSLIVAGPYRPGVSHINHGPYRPGAISTGIRFQLLSTHRDHVRLFSLSQAASIVA